MRINLSAIAAVVISTFAPQAVLACATCGCSLSSDWETQGFSAAPGWKLDMRYDYLNQDQLRSGTGTISPVTASQIVTKSGPQEVELYTKSQYFTPTIDYSNGGNWGVSLVLPYIVRDHATLGTASDGITPGAGGASYYSSTSSVGDVRVIGRWNGFTPHHDYGVLFGLKLPTGDFKLYGTSTDPANPGAPQPIDRGLQPGTGTVDAIVGAYHFDLLSQNWGYFAQGLYQRALDYREGYQPGDSLNLNVGVRYMAFSSITPQLQVNFLAKQRDRGANADQVSTGGTVAYLSPGVIAPITKDTSAYAFVQLPMYQNLNGVQLAPRFILSAGLRFVF